MLDVRYSVVCCSDVIIEMYSNTSIMDYCKCSYL